MDRRIKYTKKTIKDTFISLLSEKDIKKITVSEICKLADINRATFYRYYLDVYDLLDKIQEEFIEELKNPYIEDPSRVSSVGAFSKEILQVFIDNKELVKILFDTNNNIYFLNEVLEVAYVMCKNKWEQDIPNITEDEINYAATFIFNGALGVVNFWVMNNFDKDIDEVANAIEQLGYYGTKNYIYKK